MYNANTVDRKWFKEMAITAVLKSIFNAILDWQTDDSFSIAGREYDACCTYEFTDDFMNKPESIRLILEEYRKEILFYVADSNKKPKIWTPEQYLEYLCTTVDFIFDEEIFAPCCGHEMWEKYRAKYGDTPIEAIELIISTSIRMAGWEEEDVFNDELDSITSKKSFVEACKMRMDYLGIERTEDRIKMLCKVAKEDYEDIKDEDDGYTLIDSYRDTFKDFFDANRFEDVYMFDIDYEFYFDGFDFAVKGDIDEYLSELAEMSATDAA